MFKRISFYIYNQEKSKWLPANFYELKVKDPIVSYLAGRAILMINLLAVGGERQQ